MIPITIEIQESANVPGMQAYLDAAKKLPKNRTPAEQALVDQGMNLKEVRNADFAAREEQRLNG